MEFRNYFELIDHLKQIPTKKEQLNTIIQYCIDHIEVDYVIHAKWLPTRIRDISGNHLYDEWKCSNCETFAETNYKPKLGKYCSECGARMDK